MLSVLAAAGGDTDFNARLFADKLSKALSHNFVVSNINGNGGAVGTRRVKDAKKDGENDFVLDADKIAIKAIHNQCYETIKLLFLLLICFPERH